ncbi:beta-class carbonic anhydrase [uncultured Jatrophihabitans sp.]|uniref:beta-class carbonic anhydrase n=1 Tax=uncultured Jatrophihabitans sp. TaxID=1610747 RepID=UPI0035CC7DF9
MSATDHLVDANQQYVERFSGARPARPRLQLAVLTCMDARLDLFGALGLDIGDAHLLRNAGGIPTDDALRSLAISQRALGTREIVVIHHSECGMDGFDDGEFRAKLEQESGVAPSWRVPGFTDLYADAKQSIRTVRNCPWLPFRDDVRGFVFDVASGALTEVTAD